MSLNRDTNSSIRYYLLRFKRDYRENTRPYLYDFWSAAVDLINAFMKTVLGFMATMFGIAEEMCLKSQKKWRQK
jgi:hypothetical protein